MNLLSNFKIVLLLFIAASVKAQKISIDIAAVRNQSLQLHGVNASVFYHFTEQFSAGTELNRFFAAPKEKQGEVIYLSAWDFDINLHYYLPVSKRIILYPVLGISYSSEKEESKSSSEKNHRKYFNSGAGIIWNTKNIKPHLEYVLANSRKTEQLVLAGITIEFDLGK